MRRTRKRIITEILMIIVNDFLSLYVPVTDWREYDMEKKNSGVVYRYNPYDGCIQVTSVHPYFYAERIKNYILYFLCLKDVSDAYYGGCVSVAALYRMTG